MKMKLPKALLLAVLAGCAASAADTSVPTFTHTEYDKNGNAVEVTRYGNPLVWAGPTGNTVYTDWHEGGYQVYKNHIIGTGNSYEKELNILESKRFVGNSWEKPMPVVKDGENTTFTVAKDIAINNPLVVREGTLRFENGSKVTVDVANINNYLNLVSVGGKNAVLELDNATFSPVGVEQPSIAIGSADGAGTVKLTNGAVMRNNQYIFAGDHDGQRMTQTGWSADTTNAVYNALGTGHVKGTYNYDTEYNGTHSETLPVAYGNKNTTNEQSKIEISSRSQMIAGSSLQFGHVKVTVDGKGSILTDMGARKEITSNDFASYLGHETSGTQTVKTDIEITNGGTFESNWNLITGGKQREDAGDSFVNITVGSTNNDTSTFKVDGHFEMGGNHSATASDKSNTTLVVNAGGQALLNLVTVGDKGKGSIVVNQGGRIGTVAADERVYNHGRGSAVPSKAPLITVNETGTVTINGGSVDIDMVLNGGTLTMTEDAVAAGLTATTGTINLSGNVTFTGDVVLGSLARTTETLTINIEQGSTIVFDDQVALSNAIINVLLKDDARVSEGEILFTIASDDDAALDALATATLTFADAEGNDVTADVRAANNNVGLNANYVKSVPEPTTATLSLLALMGLAARRRRK